MTLQEAIMDPSRPLSVPPQEWMQYEEAKDEEEKEIVDGEARKVVAEEQNLPPEDADAVEVDSYEKLEIGVERMILGCRMAKRALQELVRKDATPKERAYYDRVDDIVRNALAPYLSDILHARKRLYRE